jgi:hypothetical protein
MRFACQSCGKAYNLPEEKIADKSNVKLKCRVCGAIVEVKRQGEVVAQMLVEADIKRGRVSEAPAPLNSLSPEDMLTSMSADDDGDDATHAIAVGDQILSESGSGDEAASALLGHVRSALGQRGLAPLPPQSPTGFGAATGFGSSTGFGAPPGFAPTPVPPPLSIPEPPRPEPPLFSRPEPSAPPLPPTFSSNPGSPPPPLPSPPPNPMPGPLPGSSLQNGSNGAVPRFGDAMPLPDELSIPPVAMSSAGMSSAGMSSTGMPSAAMSSASMSRGVMSSQPSVSGDTGAFALPSLELSQAPPPSGDVTRKMLAALATGILIGFIIARLFF